MVFITLNIQTQNFKEKDYSFFSFLQVFTPKRVYNGQKLTKLVSSNMPAIISKIIPNHPYIKPVAYKITTTNAAIILIARSIVPTFFFIIKIFYS